MRLLMKTPNPTNNETPREKQLRPGHDWSEWYGGKLELMRSMQRKSLHQRQSKLWHRRFRRKRIQQSQRMTTHSFLPCLKLNILKQFFQYSKLGFGKHLKSYWNYRLLLTIIGPHQLKNVRLFSELKKPLLNVKNSCNFFLAWLSMWWWAGSITRRQSYKCEKSIDKSKWLSGTGLSGDGEPSDKSINLRSR